MIGCVYPYGPGGRKVYKVTRKNYPPVTVATDSQIIYKFSNHSAGADFYDTTQIATIRQVEMDLFTFL